MKSTKTKRVKIGDRFGRLVIKEKTNKRMQGNIVWSCICDCGNTCEVPTAHLTRGLVVSCGCKREKGYKNFNIIREKGVKKLRDARVDGTSLYAIDMKKPRHNTSGYKGVAKGIRKKYRATLQFQGKSYHGGEFDTLEEAIAARKSLEEKYFDPIKNKHKNNPTSD